MPGNYKPSPRAKPCRKRNDKNVKNTLFDVINGLSLRSAAQKYDLYYSTLQRYIEVDENCRKIGGQPILDNEIENNYY